MLTLLDLEVQLLRLPPRDKLHIIQLLAQSLNVIWSEPLQPTPQKLSDFFRQSPLVEVSATGDLDLSRDRSLPRDRLIL